MSKFEVEIRTKVVVDAYPFDTIEDFQDSLDIGSRCWSSEVITALYNQVEQDNANSVCNTCNAEIKVIRKVDGEVN